MLELGYLSAQMSLEVRVLVVVLALWTVLYTVVKNRFEPPKFVTPETRFLISNQPGKFLSIPAGHPLDLLGIDRKSFLFNNSQNETLKSSCSL